MQRVFINRQDPQERLVKQAVDVLNNGGILCYPTDTVYGIGCDIFNKKAIDRIYRIKGKGYKAPLSFICPSLRGIAEYAYISNRAYKVMRHLLPGPFTFIKPEGPHRGNHPGKRVWSYHDGKILHRNDDS